MYWLLNIYWLLLTTYILVVSNILANGNILGTGDALAVHWLRLRLLFDPLADALPSIEALPKNALKFEIRLRLELCTFFLAEEPHERRRTG